MYFPTSAAIELNTSAPLPGAPSEVISVVPSPSRTFLAVLSVTGLSIWSTKPSVPLAHLERTVESLNQHGYNRATFWSPDASSMLIQTSSSQIVFVAVELDESTHPYSTSVSNTQRHFLPGPGEGRPLSSLCLRFEGVMRIEGNLLRILCSVCPRPMSILLSAENPPSIQRMPWPSQDNATWQGHDSWILNDSELPWLRNPDVAVTQITHTRELLLDTWITSDGRVYLVLARSEMRNPLIATASPSVVGASISDFSQISGDDEETGLSKGKGKASESVASLADSESTSDDQHEWIGTCVHEVNDAHWRTRPHDGIGRSAFHDPQQAVRAAINHRFSILAIGTRGGSVLVSEMPTFEKSHFTDPNDCVVRQFNPTPRDASVCAIAWSSDGYALAVGWDSGGWALWSMGGHCLAASFGSSLENRTLHDPFMHGISDFFWGPGDFDLIAVAHTSSDHEAKNKLFVIPLAKSTLTGQSSPDNNRYALLQLEDRALVYRGADQPDMSVINPESDVWQTIKIPQKYLSQQWPIRHSCISQDGRLVAVAGRRGLVHFSSASGRWKTFADERQERAFAVRGGMIWFHHVLIAAVDVGRSYQLRLYSRDLDLSNQNVLHREVLLQPVVLLSLVDNSLLVYTVDNTLRHYLVTPTRDSIILQACGSISFDGVIANPLTVRCLSWMIPSAHKQIGDPIDDLAVATILMLVGGKLALMRPRRSETREVQYDMQVLADRIEFCWLHLRGIGALENSLWGYDGQSIRLWLHALSLKATTSVTNESLKIPLDFYPLSVLMDKGIILGEENDIAVRSNLPSVLFRRNASTHLFLHHILRYHLQGDQVSEAVALASHYDHLVFFAHVLEIMLHTIVEDDDDQLLSAAVEFLDHFEDCLEVVVGCARKTEMSRWPRLFDSVGPPKQLFQSCLETNRLKTAGSYLLILHNLEQLEDGYAEGLNLLKRAVEEKDWQLSRDLLRFFRSVDQTGAALRQAIAETGISVAVSQSVNGLERGQ